MSILVAMSMLSLQLWNKCVRPIVLLISGIVFSLTAGWFSWTRQSNAMLRSVEKRILSSLKTAYKRFYVDIGPVVGPSDKIWTISLNEDSPKSPLVMLHGLGAGVALWCLNLDDLAATRPVYAIDILGFGRSSRPKFAPDAEKAEAQLVQSVEEWRREMNLDSFVLLGHSLGGYIAAAYALQHPDRVQHLILADPWGFPEKPANVQEKYNWPLWARAVAAAVQPLNPLWALRAAGPAGRWLVGKARPDIVNKFAAHLEDAETLIPDYIHQCNAQSPTGEAAFHTMMHSFGWAKNPMIHRMDKLKPTLPITVLYGSRSWVDNASGDILKQQRPNSFTNVQVINGAGHHVYLDKPELFNKFVLDACARADKDRESAVKDRESSNKDRESANKDREAENTVTPATPRDTPNTQ